jgi:hypothetical protein
LRFVLQPSCPYGQECYRLHLQMAENQYEDRRMPLTYISNG